MKPGDEEHNCLVLPLCFQMEKKPEIDLGQDYGGIYSALDSEHQLFN